MPRYDKETASCIRWSGGNYISGIESSFLTKLGGSATGSFLPWEAKSLRKESTVEGGGVGSPPLEGAISTYCWLKSLAFEGELALAHD